MTLPLFLTRHALRDIRSIEVYSAQRWGEEAAFSYITELEAAFERCSQFPGLLTSREDLHPNLRFYVVKRHLLACDVSERCIIVLAVLHARMDLVERLADLQPTLSKEIEILRRAVDDLSLD